MKGKCGGKWPFFVVNIIENCLDTKYTHHPYIWATLPRAHNKKKLSFEKDDQVYKRCLVLNICTGCIILSTDIAVQVNKAYGLSSKLLLQ